MATHSSIHAWRIPWTEEPDGLQARVSKSQTQLKQLSTLASMNTRKARTPEDIQKSELHRSHYKQQQDSTVESSC